MLVAADEVKGGRAHDGGIADEVFVEFAGDGKFISRRDLVVCHVGVEPSEDEDEGEEGEECGAKRVLHELEVLFHGFLLDGHGFLRVHLCRALELPLQVFELFLEFLELCLLCCPFVDKSDKKRDEERDKEYAKDGEGSEEF